jgi:PEP-CTERM/exosortase A-associated glycosyltransferase
MSMRVLHVLDHSIPLQSGYAFRTRAIIREQQRMGWETFHLTSPKHSAPGPADEIVDDVRFYRTAPAKGLASVAPLFRDLALMRATARRLTEIALKVKPDILHAHSPVLNAFPAIQVGGTLGIPVVYEVRAFWEDAAVDHGTIREWGPRYRLTRALETYALRRAGHVTTICEGLRRDIVARGIPERKVTVIPNAVDVHEFQFGGTSDLRLKGALGLDGKTVVGFVGSFYAYEGLDLLLAALPRIVASMPDVRVLLVGGGPEEASLRALAHKLGIDDKVVFAGRVQHSEIARYYNIVDVFAYPRHSIRLTELVTPLKPLEAMAQGRLIVASDVGGHRELIRDGKTGVLFRAGDVESLTGAIVALLRERERWPDLQAQARRFVEDERNWAQSAGRYRVVFDALKRATQ